MLMHEKPRLIPILLEVDMHLYKGTWFTLVDFLPLLKRETSCDFLFAFLHARHTLKMVHSKRKEFVPGANLSF